MASMKKPVRKSLKWNKNTINYESHTLTKEMKLSQGTYYFIISHKERGRFLVRSVKVMCYKLKTVVE